MSSRRPYHSRRDESPSRSRSSDSKGKLPVRSGRSTDRRRREDSKPSVSEWERILLDEARGLTTPELVKDELERLRRLHKKVKEQEDYFLVDRLMQREETISSLQGIIAELNHTLSAHQGHGQMRKTMMDPAINRQVKLIQDQLKETSSQLHQKAQELAAARYSQSVEDKEIAHRIVRKCHTLDRENEEFAKKLEYKNIELEQVRTQLQTNNNNLRDHQAHVAELDDFVCAQEDEIDRLHDELQRYKMKHGDINKS